MRDEQQVKEMDPSKKIEKRIERNEEQREECEENFLEKDPKSLFVEMKILWRILLKMILESQPKKLLEEEDDDQELILLLLVHSLLLQTLRQPDCLML